MKLSPTVVAVLGVVLLVGVSGCAGASSSIGAADDRWSGIPEAADVGLFSDGPVVIAYDDGGVDVVTWGSSSCPARAKSVEKADSRFVVAFETPSEGACTADMAPTTHVFTAETIGAEVPVTARVLFSEFDEDREVDIIRVDRRHAS